MKALFLLASLGAAAVPGWEAPLEIAAGRGDKGPWRQNASRYDYVDDATVAAAGAAAPGGGHLMAWADQKGKDVWLRHIGAGGRPGPAVNVSRSPATFSWLPRIAVDPARAGRVYLLWQEIIFSGGSHGGDILFAASHDGGQTFAAPRNLSRSIGGDGKGRLDRRTWSNGSLDLAVGADGTLFAAWTEYHGALWLARSRDGGAAFSAPRRIAGDGARPARGPSLAAGPGGAIHLAWSVGEDPQAAIRVAASRDNGASFAAPQLVGAGEGRPDAPRLASAGGRLHLVYARQRAPGARSDIRYTSATGGRFGAARTLSAGGAAYPMLAGDGGTGLAVAWENLGADGRAQSLGFVRSVDAGHRFSTPSVVPGSAAPAGGSNGSQQGLLGQKLALGRDGRIAIVNSSLQPGVRSRVWLMRGR
ncbi:MULTISPECIES: sialidase family protein [unclassified Massilia]|uniref:sialidase family protein n=1 Tax=unclassified Massilia TaxID=2609279 RepID=UPI00177C18B0|nr:MULTISPECIES: sialidase family protein [unclassified Massilia]MBD8528433.1 exo-alpha-sialidase [Massilia sp. CFBP 13647]MBD8671945.1 exo-alpha-sialidase [Massilia sp. CFBP 13721]